MQKLGFSVQFESEWYVLLKAPDSGIEISFLQPGLEFQAPVFQTAYNGKGTYLTIEVPGVEALYSLFKERGIAICRDLKKEEWGHHYFIVLDPNGTASAIESWYFRRRSECKGNMSQHIKEIAVFSVDDFLQFA